MFNGNWTSLPGFLLIFCAVTNGQTLSPNVKQNVLKFQWGINYKYNGELQHGLSRTWVVTKIKIPELKDIKFDAVEFNATCDWLEPLKAKFDPHQIMEIDELCASTASVMDLLKKKEQYYKDTVKALLQSELHSLFPVLALSETNFEREKRAAWREYPSVFPIRPRKGLQPNRAPLGPAGMKEVKHKSAARVLRRTKRKLLQAAKGSSGDLLKAQIEELKMVATKKDYASKSAAGTLNRAKRGLLAPVLTAVGGLLTFAIESLSGYLQRKREVAVNKALDKMKDVEKLQTNRINRLEEDFILFGKYSVETLDKIVENLQEVTERQTEIEQTVLGQGKDWGVQYLSDTGPNLYNFKLQLYIEQISQTQNAYYDPLIQQLKLLYVAISKLSKGYLPPEIFNPSKLRKITEEALSMVKQKQPEYTLALDHLADYYDMKMVTFSVDPSDHSLVVTFPVLLKNHHKRKLKLFEIETVHVPIHDKNDKANSYTRVRVDKPYMAVNNDYYIQLRMPELRMCKEIRGSHYCEELFLSRHKSLHSCESAIYYDLKWDVIKKNCEFDYFFDKKVIPSVLDGGNEIVLANMLSEKKLVCSKNFNLATPLPSDDYILVNRSILCNCQIDANLAYIFRDIGNCQETKNPPVIYHTINMAFFIVAKHKLPKNFTRKAPLKPTTKQTEIPFFLRRKAINVNTKGNLTLATREVSKLKELVRAYTQTAQTNTDINAKIDSIDTSASSPKIRAMMITVSVLGSALLAASLYIMCQHFKLKTLITGIALNGIPLARAAASNNPDNTFVCQHSWLPIIALTCTSIGLVFVIFLNCRKLTLCRGYKYSAACKIMLYISSGARFVPLEIIQVHGNLFWYSCTREMTQTDITLTKHTLWDTIALDWSDLKIIYAGMECKLPCQISVPLIDKLRVRKLLSERNHDLKITLKQFQTWHPMPIIPGELLEPNDNDRARPTAPRMNPQDDRVPLRC